MLNIYSVCLATIASLLSSVDAFTVAPAATNHPLVRKTSSFAMNMMDLNQFDGNAMNGILQTSNFIAEALGETAEPTSTFSKASYYTTLGLYVMSVPGIWSQIKRSTNAKIKRKTYTSDGEAIEGGKDLRQQAGEIMACKFRSNQSSINSVIFSDINLTLAYISVMKANNYEVVEAGEVITFRGLVQRSTSQAFFLVFCTLIGMASLALVLQIQFQDVVLPVIGKPNWFYLCLLSPYAGLYYWRAGDRVDDVKVKLASNDDDSENEITIEGNDEELERMWRTLNLREKGMVKVDGILEKV